MNGYRFQLTIYIKSIVELVLLFCYKVKYGLTTCLIERIKLGPGSIISLEIISVHEVKHIVIFEPLLRFEKSSLFENSKKANRNV